MIMASITYCRFNSDDSLGIVTADKGLSLGFTTAQMTVIVEDKK